MLRESRLIPSGHARRRRCPSERRPASASNHTLLAHCLRPGEQLRLLCSDQLVENHLDLVQLQLADRGAHLLLVVSEREKVGLEVSDRNWIVRAPPHEQEIRSEGMFFIVAYVADDLDAIGHSVASLERSRAIVHGHVSANRVGVALGLIAGKKSTHVTGAAALPFPSGRCRSGTRRWRGARPAFASDTDTTAFRTERIRACDSPRGRAGPAGHALRRRASETRICPAKSGLPWQTVSLRR